MRRGAYLSLEVPVAAEGSCIASPQGTFVGNLVLTAFAVHLLL